MNVYDTLKDLHISLPPVAAPAAAYVPFVQTGNLLFISGHIAKKDGKPWVGQLGATMQTAEGQQAAQRHQAQARVMRQRPQSALVQLQGCAGHQGRCHHPSLRAGRRCPAVRPIHSNILKRYACPHCATMQLDPIAPAAPGARLQRDCNDQPLPAPRGTHKDTTP